MTFTAHELNTLVEVLTSTFVQNEFGEPIMTWHVHRTVYAKVEPLVGKEFFAAGAVWPEVPIKVTMRWFPDLLPSQRLRFRGVTYGIESVQNIRFENRELLVFVKLLHNP